MSSDSLRKWTRRQLLQSAAGGSAAYAAGISPSLAAAGRTWSPELRADRNDYFIIDGVVHCYNHAGQLSGSRHAG